MCKTYLGDEAMRHLTEKDRYYIEVERKRKTPVKDIAAALGFSRVAIYAEIKKGTVTQIGRDLKPYQVYLSDAGQRVHDEAMEGIGRPCKLSFDDEYMLQLRQLIQKKKYSPYAAMRIVGENKICQRTVYNYVYCGRCGLSIFDLPYARPKKKKQIKKGKKLYTANKRSIEDRPKDASDRDHSGHWEMDTVYSSKDDLTCLLVLTERRTRKEKIMKIPNRTAGSVVKALNRLERKMGAPAFRETFKTITCDNGMEFTDVKGIEKSKLNKGQRTMLYFAHPYCSGERGSNENQNKMIRRWIPKGDDIGLYTDMEIQQIEDWINNLPRKMFGGLSSVEYEKLIR